MDQQCALLALLSRAQVGLGLARLAQVLLSARDFRPLLEDPEWRPRARDWAVAARQCPALSALTIALIPVWHFPAWLLRLRPRPPLLFVRGNADLLTRTAIGIVGARHASPGPRAWAYGCARQAAAQGLLVVSGGAHGIDTAAHQGALDAGGQTLAYLGVGADRIYPKSNAGLFVRILMRGGALATEYPPRVTTFSCGHARRNRFIAGHASRLYVAEAALESGSLGTADWARRLRVPIWVPPRETAGARSGIDRLLLAGQAHIWPTSVSR